MNNKDGKVKIFTLRLNKDLFEKVKQNAVKNKRSIAKQIEYYLEEYTKIQN